MKRPNIAGSTGRRSLQGLLMAALAVVLMEAAPGVAPAMSVDTIGWVAPPGMSVTEADGRLELKWQISAEEAAVLRLNLAVDKPLISELGMERAGRAGAILENVNPFIALTVGERDLGSPAGWVAFFDNPAQRGYRAHFMKFDKKRVQLERQGNRAVVTVHDVEAGPFRGHFQFTIFPGSALIFAEAVVRTEQDGIAILYDAGLTAPMGPVEVRGPPWKGVAWLDVKGVVQRESIEVDRVAAPLSVSRRCIAAETSRGTVVVFPPPHQYFYPLDFATNLGFAWSGRGNNWSLGGYGFGVQQPPLGDRRFAAWCNAPPRTDQRLGLFYLLSPTGAETTLAEASRYTRGDQYKKLPGHVTFSSHYHFEHTAKLLARREEIGDPEAIPRDLLEPGFVKTFKLRGIDIVHTAEFHLPAMPGMPTESRLSWLRTLFSECSRLSDKELLLLPGEEANVHLGGHWLSFFPHPVYWVLNRAVGAPFVEQRPGFGKVYHVGNPADVLRLMEDEKGLMWTAHPRIKGSRGYPDGYFATDFYSSDRFLGGAWKSMPVDNSLPRLGSRVLDLQDETANLGQRKYYVGEADIFGVEPEMETYAHLNVNYLKLEQVPRFADGWQPVLDALRGGKFFVSTGEVLIPAMSVAGAQSGDELLLPADGRVEFRASMEWTFPLAFAEVISGDGDRVYRQRIDLSDTAAFGQRELALAVDLKGRKWVRLEVWDVARNGAFTPPVWLIPEHRVGMSSEQREQWTCSGINGKTTGAMPRSCFYLNPSLSP